MARWQLGDGGSCMVNHRVFTWHATAPPYLGLTAPPKAIISRAKSSEFAPSPMPWPLVQGLMSSPARCAIVRAGALRHRARRRASHTHEARDFVSATRIRLVTPV
jgi:hypothetical protein